VIATVIPAKADIRERGKRAGGNEVNKECFFMKFINV
jgi:hypothetical protein